MVSWVWYGFDMRYMKGWLIIAALVGVVFASATLAASSEKEVTLYIAGLENNLYDHREQYYFDMIRLAARKSGLTVHLKHRLMPELRENRAILELQKGTIDIYWMATNTERERSLRPIRMPLYKGLIGWRVMLVSEGKTDIFTKLKSLEEIKKLVAGQGHDWPDSDILEANGYTVHRSSSWSGLFELVNLRRVDYFPRSAVEIQTELAIFPSLKLEIEPSVVFQYPMPYYLFLNKSNEDLAVALENGFYKAVDDGDFDLIFYRYFGKHLKSLNLSKRQKIQLINPALPPKTPLNKKNLWFGSGA
ncbi:MAG: hypothetical protein COA42_20390 [Alteromonadaceae bacterium]|nr:MAG: hypothetical protein COA42_20390 [Alteromonadaceae bacterium]